MPWLSFFWAPSGKHFKTASITSFGVQNRTAAWSGSICHQIVSEFLWRRVTQVWASSSKAWTRMEASFLLDFSSRYDIFADLCSGTYGRTYIEYNLYVVYTYVKYILYRKVMYSTNSVNFSLDAIVERLTELFSTQKFTIVNESTNATIPSSADNSHSHVQSRRYK